MRFLFFEFILKFSTYFIFFFLSFISIFFYLLFILGIALCSSHTLHDQLFILNFVREYMEEHFIVMVVYKFCIINQTLFLIIAHGYSTYYNDD